MPQTQIAAAETELEKVRRQRDQLLRLRESAELDLNETLAVVEEIVAKGSAILRKHGKRIDA